MKFIGNKALYMVVGVHFITRCTTFICDRRYW